MASEKKMITVRVEKGGVLDHWFSEIPETVRSQRLRVAMAKELVDDAKHQGWSDQQVTDLVKMLQQEIGWTIR